MSREKWSPVVGTDNYYVSDRGQVRGASGKLRKPWKTAKGGHSQLDIYYPEGRRNRLVHQLVLESFVGPRPEGRIGCHRNGDPNDNRLCNLYYGTFQDNSLDTVRHGNNHNAKKDRCVAGHLFDEGNTYWRTDKSGRECRECRRLAKSRYNSRR